MDVRLVKAAHNALPKMNPVIARGVVAHRNRGIYKYLRSIVSNMCSGIPGGKVLFKELRILPPDEAFRHMLKLKINNNQIDNPNERSNNGIIDTTRSDCLLYKLDIALLTDDRGELIKTFVFEVPYVSDGNQFTFRDTSYKHTPVMGNPIIDRSKSKLTLIFPRIKHEVKRVNYPFQATTPDGNWLNRDDYLVWSKLHNGSQNKDKDFKIGKGYPALGLYLFSKHGLFHTFSEYGDIDDIHIYSDRGEDPFDADAVDYDEYIVFRSSLIDTHSKTLAFKKEHNPAAYRNQLRKTMRNVKEPIQAEPGRDGNIYIVVNKEQINTSPIGLTLILTILSTADSIGFDAGFTQDDIDSVYTWRAVLGNLYKPNHSQKEAIVDIGNHLNSIDAYVDNLVVDEYRQQGINVKFGDITRVLYHAMVEMSKPQILDPEIASDISNAKIMVYQYLLEDIVVSINQVLFQIRNQIINNDGKLLSKTVEGNNRKMYIKRDAWSNLRYRSNHPETSLCGDKTVSNITINSALFATMQANRIPGKKDSNRDINIHDPANHADFSIATHGSYMACAKSDTAITGRGHINPYLVIDMTNWTTSARPSLLEIEREARLRLRT